MSNGPIEIPQKRKAPKGTGLAIAVVCGIIAIFVAGYFLIPLGQGRYDERYATVEAYEVIGHIVKSESKQKRSNMLVDLEIETEEALPDGTHTYKSNDEGDYRRLGHYADDLDTRLVFTISESGHIREAHPEDKKTS